MDSLSREQALNFVEKLSKKTVERGATREEAIAAAAKIQQLCQEYNVSVAEAVARGEEQAEPIGSMVINTSGNSQRSILLNICAKFNFCRAIILRGRTHRTAIVGTKMNQTVVNYLYHSLYQQLNFFYTQDLIQEERAHGKMMKRDALAFRRGWWDGAFLAIMKRFADQQKTFEQNNMALVVSSKSLVDDKFNQLFPSAKSGKSKNYQINSDAGDLGYNAGNRVQMNKGVGSSAAPKQIGG